MIKYENGTKDAITSNASKNINSTNKYVQNSSNELNGMQQPIDGETIKKRSSLTFGLNALTSFDWIGIEDVSMNGNGFSIGVFLDIFPNPKNSSFLIGIGNNYAIKLCEKDDVYLTLERSNIDFYLGNKSENGYFKIGLRNALLLKAELASVNITELCNTYVAGLMIDTGLSMGKWDFGLEGSWIFTKLFKEIDSIYYELGIGLTLAYRF